MDKYQENLKTRLEKREKDHLLRKLKIWPSDHIDFFSNDYLGLSKKFESQNLEASGSGGSRLLAGNHHIHHAFEKELSEFYNAEALLFNSGFDANLALFASVPRKGDLILFDAQIHNSIRQGIVLSQARALKFKHNDFRDLESKLEAAEEKNIFIAVESLYSMDGSILELKKLIGIATKYDAAILLDEAHSNGIFAIQGQGLASELKLESKIFARMLGFGKAFGQHGAAVLGSQLLKEYLLNFANSLIYSTSLPPHQVRSLQTGLSQVKGANEEREKLWENVNYYRSQLKIKQNILTNKSPIQFIQVSGNQKAKDLSQKMFQHKINIAPVLQPTVAKGFEGLRLCLHSFNSKKEIDLLLDLL